MQNAQRHASPESFHRLAGRWIDDQIAHSIAELSQILLDKAMNDEDRHSAILYFKHHKYLENNRQKITNNFRQLVNKALAGDDPSMNVIPQQRPSPELVSLLDSVNNDADLYTFCTTLREEVFTTLFQRAFNIIDPAPLVRDVAREVFRCEFSSQLGLLYILLLEQTSSQGNENRRVDRRANILAWIQHLENKLLDSSIDASTRSLTKDRLEELQAKLGSLDSLSLASRRLRDRWLHPHDELQHKECSDEELLAEVDKLFSPLTSLDGISRSLKALATRIRPIVESVALTDRGSFLSALHPARQLLNQTAATATSWLDNSADQRRQMLRSVKQSVDVGVEARIGSYQGNPEFIKILHQELVDYLAYQLHRVEREEQEMAGQLQAPQPISFMRDINANLEAKLDDVDIPPLVHKLIFGLWNRVIAEIWLEYGEDGIATQQALSLVDDILWYLQCDDAKLQHTNTEFLGDQIERDLLGGLKMIDYNNAKGIALISSLKRLRKQLHASPYRNISSNIA